MLRLLKRKPRPSPDPWDASRVLLQWSEDIAWSIADSYMGTMVLGSTGSGKSSGSVSLLSRSMLMAGYGGLYLTVKNSDRNDYIRYIREAGRLDDLVIFSPEHRVFYDFIADEMASTSSPHGFVENLTALIMTLAELGDGQRSGGSDTERFFRQRAAMLCKNALLVLVLSGERVTITNLHRLIVSAPQSPEQVTSEAWQKTSFCYLCLSAADKAPKSDSLRADFELALSEFLQEWPALASRTRSSVQATLTAPLDVLSRGAARDMTCSPSPNLSFTQMFEGKVIIADFPLHELHEIGRTIQVIMKYMCQRACARRDVSKHPRPVFIVADEAQELLVDADQRFQAIARSTRTAVVYATQSVSGLNDAFGPQSEAKVHALLTNLQSRVAHQQTDIKTIEYMQNLIGRSRQILCSGNQSREENWLAPLFGTDKGATSGFSESMEFELTSHDLNGLAKGGPPHNFTEAIVYLGGRDLSGGRTWVRARIPQR